jgi:hypothetical protein
MVTFLKNNLTQTQNFTSDNVSVNDKSMCILGEKLKDNRISFNVKQQQSQYVLFV